jgi:hypothetical protein
MNTKEVRRMTTHLRLAGFVPLVLGLTGARPGSDEAVALSGACELITRQEAATALGAPVPAGTEKIMNLPLKGATIQAQYCFYGSEVIVARFDLGSTAEEVFGQYRESLASQPGYETVSGVGDEAFAAKGQLAVRKGKTGLIIDVGQARGGGAPELKAEKGLAAHALRRI